MIMVTETEPQHGLATNLDAVVGAADLYLLGVAHRDCAHDARQRLEGGLVQLPVQLPMVRCESIETELESLDLPPALGRCPFCGSSGLTEEHVWPKWISRLLVDNVGTMLLPSPWGPRQSTELKLKVPICRECNNDWLGTLETDVGPILGPMVLGPMPGEPQARTLTSDEQRLLAKWAVKMALMFDLYARPNSTIPAFYYRQFYLYKQALPNMVVLLGAYRGAERAVAVAHSGLNIGLEPTEKPDAFMTLFTAFRVVFKVFGYVGQAFPQQVEYDSAFWDAVERIWPPRGEAIAWPRNGQAFNDQNLMPFGAERPRLTGEH